MKYTDLTFVAHRGYQAQYPENTLVAIDAAYKAGIKHIEFDVQLSSDQQPVIYHDATLERVSGRSGYLHHHTLNELLNISASESDRLGERFNNETVTPLVAVRDWLKVHPGVTLYVEIKPEILDHTSVETTIKAVIHALEGVLEQCIVMSFSKDIVRQIDQIQTPEQQIRTGIVIKEWEDIASGQFEQFERETPSLAVVFCNHHIIPRDFDFNCQDLPWVLYETSDRETVERFMKQGCKHFESYIAPELSKLLRK